MATCSLKGMMVKMRELGRNQRQGTIVTEGEGDRMFNSEGGKPRNEGKDHVSPTTQSNGFQFAFSVHSGRILCMSSVSSCFALHRAETEP